VRVTSDLPDGTSGVSSLAFGGNQAMSSVVSGATAQAMNQLSWFSANNKHRLKLNTELRRESWVQDASSNLLGTFTFNSLEDLAADRPASFSRTDRGVGAARRATPGGARRQSDDLPLQSSGARPEIPRGG